jgi:hypothetical protein
MELAERTNRYGGSTPDAVLSRNDIVMFPTLVPAEPVRQSMMTLLLPHAQQNCGNDWD